MKMKNIAAVLWPAAWLLLWLRAAVCKLRCQQRCIH